MKRITPNRVVVFIGVMSAVALLIYLPRYGREQRQAQSALQQQRTVENEAAAQQASQEAAAQRAEYLMRYVDTTFVKKPGVRTVALVLAPADGKQDRAVADALARRFQSDTVQILPSFIRSAFISDGLFESAFNGSDDIPRKLELAKFLDGLLLARESVEYSANGPDLENVLTATMRLDVIIIPIAGNSTGQTWSFTAAGSGFTRTAAQAMAEERLAKQIAEDTKMSM